VTDATRTVTEFQNKAYEYFGNSTEKEKRSNTSDETTKRKQEKNTGIKGNL